MYPLYPFQMIQYLSVHFNKSGWWVYHYHPNLFFYFLPSNGYNFLLLYPFSSTFTSRYLLTLSRNILLIFLLLIFYRNNHKHPIFFLSLNWINWVNPHSKLYFFIFGNIPFPCWKEYPTYPDRIYPISVTNDYNNAQISNLQIYQQDTLDSYYVIVSINFYIFTLLSTFYCFRFFIYFVCLISLGFELFVIFEISCLKIVS